MSALNEARRELDEIDWTHGIAPMPAHLVERGTLRREYTKGVRLKERPHVGFWLEGDPPPSPLRYTNDDLYDLPEPYYEIRVWGELVERGPL